LAIELAAARVRSIAPAEIAAHLDQRFRLLSAGRRTAPTRQQTSRGAIDWSYELLDEFERHLLARLSAFAGFDLAAVEAVTTGAPIDAGDMVGVLDRLVDKSPVAVDVSAGAHRYRLDETIRDCAWTAWPTGRNPSGGSSPRRALRPTVRAGRSGSAGAR
jgi:predicted ATPase